MSIDIKSLRIGSHILVNGKRERVRGLDEDNDMIIRFPAEHVLASEVEPIPITPELLKELGFQFSCFKDEGDDDGDDEDDEYWAMHRYNENKKWTMMITLQPESIGYFVFVKASGYKSASSTVRYLHELEGMLTLYGVELIHD